MNVQIVLGYVHHSMSDEALHQEYCVKHYEPLRCECRSFFDLCDLHYYYNGLTDHDAKDCPLIQMTERCVA